MSDLPPRRRLLVRLSLALLALAGGGVLLWAVAAHEPTEATFFPKCVFHSVTGLHCVGCGLTRSLHSWLTGDVRQAVAWHPLSVVVLPLLAWHALSSLWWWAWGLKPTARRPVRWPLYVLAAVLLAFMVVRNIPAEPWCWLAPHELR